MKKIYFLSILVIVLAELALLIWFLVANIPLTPGGLFLQQNAPYSPFISPKDTSHIAVTVTRWLFFLLIAGTLIPTNTIIIGELTRWFMDQYKKANKSLKDNS
ncbi:MAG: hypothetical protein Q8P44_04470 [Dehalococcoidia bacterium]|nr:hypothetical protein [Dehalococcoidia bacterium]